MTKEEKKERRMLRHRLQNTVETHHFSLEARLVLTARQVRSAASRVADQLIAGKNPGEVQRVDAVVPDLQEAAA